jgi:hypothetical protein
MLLYACFAAVAGGIAGFVSNGFDVIKTRWQVESHFEHISFSKFVKEMVFRDGYTVFLRGGIARALWTIPNVVISFTFYDVLKY